MALSETSEGRRRLQMLHGAARSCTELHKAALHPQPSWPAREAHGLAGKSPSDNCQRLIYGSWASAFPGGMPTRPQAFSNASLAASR